MTGLVSVSSASEPEYVVIVFQDAIPANLNESLALAGGGGDRVAEWASRCGNDHD